MLGDLFAKAQDLVAAQRNSRSTAGDACPDTRETSHTWSVTPMTAPPVTYAHDVFHRGGCLTGDLAAPDNVYAIKVREINTLIAYRECHSVERDLRPYRLVGINGGVRRASMMASASRAPEWMQARQNSLSGFSPMSRHHVYRFTRRQLPVCSRRPS